MKGQPAKILAGGELRRALAIARRRRYPRRNCLMLMLSFKAGLRACEIAKLRWDMVLGPSGNIGHFIELPAAAAKKGSGRRIPMNPELRTLLAQMKSSQRELAGPIVLSERGGPMTAKSVVNWFKGIYRLAGLSGCSSHSGRRTFVTRAARLLAKTGGSLRDVQQLAGHRSIQTTQGYIEGDGIAQRRLVRML